MKHIYLVDLVPSKFDNGVKTYVNALLSGLESEKGITLSVIKINSFISHEYKKERKGAITVHNFPLPFVNKNIFENVKTENLFYNRILDFLEDEIMELKEVIFHFNWINHSSFADLVKKRFGCKTVLTKHCIPWKTMIFSNYTEYLRLQEALENETYNGSLPYELVAEKQGYGNYDKIITVTETGRKNLIQLFKIPSISIETIYNGISFEKPPQHLSRAKLKRRLGFRMTDIIILYVGRPEKLAGLLLFINGIKQILISNRNVKVVIVGDSISEQLLNASDNLWPSLVYTHHISSDKLAEFYQIADIGILPSLYEQCSYVALEMILNNTPIVVSEIDGLAEIVENGYSGVSIPLRHTKDGIDIDPKFLNDKIEELIADKKLRYFLSKNAKKELIKKHGLKLMTQRTIEIYNNLN